MLSVHVWKRELRSVTQFILNTSFWKKFTEYGRSQIFIYFENLCCKDLQVSNMKWYGYVFVKLFQKMTFYHYTLGADICTNILFYYWFYYCETSILESNSWTVTWNTCSLICFFFQNSCKVIFSREHLFL